MIIAEQENTKVETNIPVGEFKNFTIKESKKAFDILQSSLYKDSIATIIREVSTNAYDSHIMAKQIKPFKIHLPTTFEPYFSVEDFGLGISHEDVLRIYSTFFESTKNMSNEAVDALGLGSKSPLAYSKNFTVVSIYNGLESTYSIFIDDEGIPAIVRMAVSTTTQDNGVMVRLSVKSDDIYKWKDKAKIALAGFPETSYESNSSQKYSIKYSPIILSNKDVSSEFGVYVNDYSFEAKSYLKMGCVIYPIDIADIIENSSLSDQIKKVIEQSVDSETAFVIESSIGDVDILPSREGLKNTKKTVDFVSSKLADFVRKIRSSVKDTITNFNPEYSKITALEFQTIYDLISPKSNTDKTVKEIMRGFISADFSLNVTDDMPPIWRSHTHREKYSNQHELIVGQYKLVKNGKLENSIRPEITIVKRLTSLYGKSYVRGNSLRVLESDLTPTNLAILEDALAPSGIKIVREVVVPKQRSSSPVKKTWYTFFESYTGKASEISKDFLTETHSLDYDYYCELDRFTPIGLDGFTKAEILNFVRKNRVVFIRPRDRTFNRSAYTNLRDGLINHYAKLRQEIDGKFHNLIKHVQQTNYNFVGQKNPLDRFSMTETGIPKIDAILKKVDTKGIPVNEIISSPYFMNTYISMHVTESLDPRISKFITTVNSLVGYSFSYDINEKEILVKLIEVCYNHVFQE
jgi:hypothetical protein